MSDFNLPVSDAPADPQKLSVSVFWSKNAFYEHFSHNPGFCELSNSCFQNFHGQPPIWTFLVDISVVTINAGFHPV